MAGGWLWVLPAKCHECLAGDRAGTVKDIMLLCRSTFILVQQATCLPGQERWKYQASSVCILGLTKISRESWRQLSRVVPLGVL